MFLGNCSEPRNIPTNQTQQIVQRCYCCDPDYLRLALKQSSTSCFYWFLHLNFVYRRIVLCTRRDRFWCFTFLMLVSEITLSLMFAVVSFNPSPSASVEYLHPVCWFNINRFLWVCVQPWHPSALQRSHTVNLKALQEVCRETSRATFSISLFA